MSATATATATLERPTIDALLKQHRPMVRRLAQKLMARLPANVELDDLLQAGMIGLADALSRSESSEGPQFEAFAMQRINGAMLDELRAADWVSRDTRRQQRSAGTAVQRLEQRLGRAPNASEVAGELGVTLADYQALRATIRGSQFVSLEDVMGSDDDADGGSAIERHVADPDADPLRHVNDHRRYHALVDAIEELPERERQALSLYYEHDMSLKDIGSVLGVTESRVCHLHGQAIRRLRVKLREW
jgi:RNA polymerase sigma factor for flagellar operon FliA